MFGSMGVSHRIIYVDLVLPVFWMAPSGWITTNNEATAFRNNVMGCACRADGIIEIIPIDFFTADRRDGPLGSGRRGIRFIHLPGGHVIDKPETGIWRT